MTTTSTRRTDQPDASATLTRWLTEFPGVPGHVLHSLWYYRYDRQPTGGFLQAVLENNLYRAATSADTGNRAALGDIARFVYTTFPSRCCGSPDRVKGWLAGVGAID